MSKLGIVTSVNVFDGNVYVTTSRKPTHEDRGIRFRTPSKHIWVVPEEGDRVEISELDDGTKIAHSPRPDNEEPAPDGLTEGDIAFKLNADTTLRFSKNGDGSYDINLECDGELNIVGDDVKITEGGTPKSVLTEDAVFEYEDTTINDTSDGTGSSSTTTKETTTVSNGETTETDIE